ncbi:hypothetical protein I6A84_34260 [Frankia sp. CNm7]|uniref:Uncharacterized protein n=1 Tax=Frankia nepalensis TaxID=1836974 RepID=A0A937ULP9_9ACTN|nr:hypothetical protein [Frankia nepalensis]MBL7501648.1 hypothetical protein [Frankia nepalensis]MBL7513368.1 hypothetical protein [Frankia nepalensis]MBL7523011.1 hypothetical protein [Frankia nepalensis]MBL7628079.1 hypothetical protein [Frankia nepalensis]
MVDLVFECLAKARQEGIGVILIEQHPYRALDRAGDRPALHRGQTARTGATRGAYDEDLRPYLGDSATGG